MGFCLVILCVLPVSFLFCSAETHACGSREKVSEGIVGSMMVRSMCRLVESGVAKPTDRYEAFAWHSTRRDESRVRSDGTCLPCALHTISTGFFQETLVLFHRACFCDMGGDPDPPVVLQNCPGSLQNQTWIVHRGRSRGGQHNCSGLFVQHHYAKGHKVMARRTGVYHSSLGVFGFCARPLSVAFWS
jgi:hypothetical protein